MTTAARTCINDLHHEAWDELQAAKAAKAQRDDMANQVRLHNARLAFDQLLDAANDCE